MIIGKKAGVYIIEWTLIFSPPWFFGFFPPWSGRFDFLPHIARITKISEFTTI